MPPFDERSLEALGYRRQPDGSYCKPSRVVAGIPDAKPERAPADAPLRTNQNEKSNRRRITVCITGHRCRPVDPDNFAGGCKILIDQLRAFRLIPDDDPGTIELITRQIRVRTRAEEGTEVKIYE